MKTFKRRSLPDFIIYNGKKYNQHHRLSNEILMRYPNTRSREAALKSMGKKAVMIECLHRNLVGKLDLHGQPYKPSQFLYIYDNE